MAETIYMRVGERDVIDFSDFVAVCTHFLSLLKDVDSAIAQRKNGNLDWKLTALERQPIPIVGVTPRARRIIKDTSDQVEKHVITSVKVLTESGERGQYFSDSALTHVRKIAEKAPKIGASQIYVDTKENFSVSTVVTTKTLDQVRDLTDVKSKSYGVVVGTLGSISIRRGNEFRVWDENTDRPVRCSFRAEQETLVKDLLRKRVMVTGIVNSDRYGFPLSVNAEAVEGVEKGDLPSIEEMIGLVPDITGGLTLKEFLEDSD